MIIKKIAFGDSLESYIEDRLNDNLNVIFSDDNNKGKTILFQGLMFSLGYDSIFPSSFNKKDKYFYSLIVHNEREFEFLRKNNSIVVKMDSGLQTFSSMKDFKYFFDENIYKLPKIFKDGRYRTIDLSLLFEVFFIGQDHRTPSNLIFKGAFNKIDFKNMVKNLDYVNNNYKEIKDSMSFFSSEMKGLKKKIKIIKESPSVAQYVSKAYDNELFKRSLDRLTPVYDDLTDLKKSRDREVNRRFKLEKLVTELNSLNRELSEGKVKCGDCGSSKVIYSNDEMSFNVSDINVRSDILNSIKKQIEVKNEIIEEYTHEINTKQTKLNNEIALVEPSIVDILVHREHIIEGVDYDEQYDQLNKKIKELNDKLFLLSSESNFASISIAEIQGSIIDEMNKLIVKVDPHSTIHFDDLFTKRDVTFSGSEEQEFYFCKIFALNEILKHDFPIIIDSFRDGEISTEKENIIIELFKGINKQVILSATLKNEEYEAEKYQQDNFINAIDYSSHADSKILSNAYSLAFNKIIESFGIDV